MNVQKISNSLWIVTVPVSDFKIEILNQPKKVSGKKNYANASFFGGYSEANPKATFTLPIGHLICDRLKDTSSARQYWEDYYMKQRGPYNDTSYCFDGSSYTYNNKQFHGKALTTLTVTKGNVANIKDIKALNLDSGYKYAISGIPLMLNGSDVSWANYVKPQGWYGNELYGTYHTILAIKKANATEISIIGWKSTTGNMISSGEAYKMLKRYGFYSAIAEDGGGSFLLDVNGSRIQTSENRHIQSIVTWSTGSSSNSGSTSGTTPTTPTTPASYKDAATTANLNMRTGPGTNYGVVTTIPKNTAIKVDSSYSNASWYKVSYGSRVGYCSSAYIKIGAAASTGGTSGGSSSGSTKYAASNPYPVPTSTLQVGAKGEQVKWLQWMLYNLGFNGGSSKSAFIDGSFGNGTKTQVKNWQAKYGLVADGSFGPASLAKMKTL